MDLCGVCGALARGAKSPERDLRGRTCPRFGAVHLGCCAVQECCRIDARRALRCDFVRWERARVAVRR